MNDFQTLNQMLKPLTCVKCRAYLSTRFNSDAFITICCQVRMCQTCIKVSTQINRCLCCQSLFQNNSFKKELGRSGDPEANLSRAGYHVSEVVKHTLRIGFVPLAVTAEQLNFEWLPCFDSEFGDFISQISRIEISKDPQTDGETNVLNIILIEPYLFTKFFFALESRVLRHKDINFLFCAVFDHKLYAAENYRNELAQRFDLVLIPHGQPLEQQIIAIENLDHDPNFIRNCNLARANIEKGSFSVRKGVGLFKFESPLDLIKFSEFISEHHV